MNQRDGSFDTFTTGEGMGVYPENTTVSLHFGPCATCVPLRVFDRRSTQVAQGLPLTSKQCKQVSGAFSFIRWCRRQGEGMGVYPENRFALLSLRA